MKSKKKGREKKVNKMIGEVATGYGQIGKDIAIWLQAWATTNGVEKKKKEEETKN